MTEKESYVYILELENNKWYVGWTTDVHRRFSQHCSGEGARWTKLHKPIRIAHYRRGDLTEENRLTRSMMEKFGWKNVRGGPFCDPDMNQPPGSIYSPVEERKKVEADIYIIRMEDGRLHCCYEHIPGWIKGAGVYSILKVVRGTGLVCSKLRKKLIEKYGLDAVICNEWELDNPA